MFLQRARGAGNRLSIPYEISMCIIDAIIDDAFAAGIQLPENTINWTIFHANDVTSKLGVVPSAVKGSLQPAYWILRDRYRSVSVALGLNRETRAKAHRKFRPVTIFPRLAHVHALSLPEIDSFTLPYDFQENDFTIRSRSAVYSLLRVLQRPNSETYALMHGIQHLYFHDMAWFSDDYRNISTMVASALAFPNLKTITVVVRNAPFPERDDKIYHPKRQPIGFYAYPMLCCWKHNEANRKKLWPPFQERGIKLYGCFSGSFSPFMEIIVTDEDVSMEYLYPNCSCCERN